MVFITKLGPQVSLFPVPFFGVNTQIAADMDHYVAANMDCGC
jgi:hypothetical protein